jgi:hypothetical protein
MASSKASPSPKKVFAWLGLRKGQAKSMTALNDKSLNSVREPKVKRMASIEQLLMRAR